MVINSIVTKRRYERRPSYDLVYEWEDVLMHDLSVTFFNEPSYYKYARRLPLVSHLCSYGKGNTLIFEMVPQIKYRGYQRNIIPWIIDYFLNDEQIPFFERAYKENPLVLISSAEVYERLQKKSCLTNLAHLPLSISDKYEIRADSKFEKSYDLILMGRQNPVFMKYLEKYKMKYQLKYVYRKQENGKFLYFASDGYCLGDINTREQYIALMRKGKCGLYSTPGIDGGELRTGGFNQVTPRFLELVACGCHILARYKPNADTEFYQLDKFSSHIDSYEEFEKAMQKALNKEVNMIAYEAYLKQHYTSNVIKKLKELLNNI